MTDIPNSNNYVDSVNARLWELTHAAYLNIHPSIAQAAAAQSDQGEQAHNIGHFPAVIFSQWDSIPGTYIGPVDTTNQRGTAMNEYLLDMLKQKGGKL